MRNKQVSRLQAHAGTEISNSNFAFQPARKSAGGPPPLTHMANVLERRRRLRQELRERRRQRRMMRLERAQRIRQLAHLVGANAVIPSDTDTCSDSDSSDSDTD
jgi:hypothetical protein